jgi:hypothetical protein
MFKYPPTLLSIKKKKNDKKKRQEETCGKVQEIRCNYEEASTEKPDGNASLQMMCGFFLSQ